MNWFASVITAFCTAGVCFGALFIISPTGKTGKSVQYIISLCFLLIIVSVTGFTIKSADFSINFETDYQSQSIATIINTLEHAYALALQRAGIEFEEISVSADISENGRIECTKVIINSAVIRDKIINALGGERENFKVEVINE